jgi:hypothetical protein
MKGKLCHSEVQSPHKSNRSSFLVARTSRTRVVDGIGIGREVAAGEPGWDGHGGCGEPAGTECGSGVVLEGAETVIFVAWSG